MTAVFTEKDLSELAAELGLSYEIDYNIPAYHNMDNKSCTVMVWVKMKGLRSKRYAVFAYGGGKPHTKRHCFEIVLPYGKNSFLPKDIWLVRDRAADFMVKRILIGCSIKISNTRRIVIPPADSIEEFRLKLAVKGGCR